MSRCHICGASDVATLQNSTSIVGVSSDCLPLGSGQPLGACFNCGTVVTMVNDVWRELCKTIYSGYAAYRQASGSEDRVFTEHGVSRGRSRQVVDLCAPYISESFGSWLDFGCGNGTFLRSVNEHFSGRKLVGMEFDDHVRHNILTIPGVVDLITSWDSHLADDLSVISMIHVLEHIEDPRALLQTAWSRLKPGGALIVEVPHVWTNPYALTVSDHATHFGVASLSRLIRSVGFELVWVGADVIVGEITLVAKRRPRQPGNSHIDEGLTNFPPESMIDEHLPQRLVSELVATSEWLISQRTARGTLGILGTSIAGTWAGATLNFDHDLWVDEDPSRVGNTWLGKRVLSPSQVPRGTQVLVVLAPGKARPAAMRLGAQFTQFSVDLPPTFGDSFANANLHGW